MIVMRPRRAKVQIQKSFLRGLFVIATSNRDGVTGRVASRGPAYLFSKLINLFCDAGHDGGNTARLAVFDAKAGGERPIVMTVDHPPVVPMGG